MKLKALTTFKRDGTFRLEGEVFEVKSKAEAETMIEAGLAGDVTEAEKRAAKAELEEAEAAVKAAQERLAALKGEKPDPGKGDGKGEDPGPGEGEDPPKGDGK